MFCPQKSDHVAKFIRGQSSLEGRHGFAAVLDLVGNLNGLAVFADIGQRRGLLRTLRCRPVTVGAAFVPEEGGACCL